MNFRNYSEPNKSNKKFGSYQCLSDFAVIDKDATILLLLDRLELPEKLVEKLKDEIRHLKERLVIKNSSNSSSNLITMYKIKISLQNIVKNKKSHNSI